MGDFPQSLKMILLAVEFREFYIFGLFSPFFKKQKVIWKIHILNLLIIQKILSETI